MPLTQPLGTDAPDRSEAWVQESRNLPEWKRLQAALNLAQGFEFLAVATEDVAAEELLGRLLERHAKERGVALRGFDISNPPQGKHLVTAILDEVGQAPRPCWFWFRGGKRTKAEEAELGHLFLLLNQKRDVISKRADAPFLFVLHPFDWKVFRRNAPDFWSIHHAVFRFGPGARPESLRPDVPLDLGLGQLAAQPSRGPHWRMELESTAESGSEVFVGRISEIRQLTAALVERSARFLVSGPGGIGKTSLVRTVLPMVASRYSEGVWWVPFGDLPGNPREQVTAALTGILADLLPYTVAPSALEDLAQLFRSATADSPRLFVFDDVDDSTAIEWLIPGKSSSVVVTSRFSRPTSVRIEQLQLGALSEVDSVALLRRIAPGIGAQAAEVARLCGYLPLALHLTAGALASQPGLSPADLIHKLNEIIKRSPTGGPAALVNVSLKALSLELQKRYRQLGVFAGNFDAPAAAAVWGLGEEGSDKAEIELGSLARSGLLEERNGRFELHPSLCEAVWSPLSSEEKAVIRLRHAAHYCEVLRQASHLYQEDERAGLALFDLEAHQIRVGQARTAKNPEGQVEAARLASEYPIAGGQILEFRLAPSELVKWLEAGLAGARRVHGPGLEGYFLRNLGLALAAAGQVQEAIEMYNQAAHMAAEEGDRYSEADAIRALGRAYETLGETQRAVEHYEKYLSLAREMGDRLREGDALDQLARAYMVIGEPKQAIAISEQHLALTREVGDRRGGAAVLGNLGTSYAALGELQQAIDFYEHALAAEREINNPEGIATVLGYLGRIYSSLGDPRRAIDFFAEALSVRREIGDRTGESIALVNLANAYSALGETRRAIDSYEKALGISRELGDRVREGRILGNLGFAFTALGDLNRATCFFEEQLVLARDLGDRRGEATASWNLGVVYEQRGELHRAIDLMQESVDYERVVGHPDAERDAEKVEELRTRLEAADEADDGPGKSE